MYMFKKILSVNLKFPIFDLCDTFFQIQKVFGVFPPPPQKKRKTKKPVELEMWQ